jgi:hypothetical protein
MSQSFSYDLSVPVLPAEAQARSRDAVTEQMSQTAKMRLATENSNSLLFRPKWSWPLLAALFRVVGGETVKLDFRADDGGTRVTVSGKVGGDAQNIANRDFWAQTLGAD